MIELKCDPDLYPEICYNRKQFDIRLDDRDYRIGQQIAFKEVGSNRSHRVIVIGIEKITVEDAEDLLSFSLNKYWSDDEITQYGLVKLSIQDDYRTPEYLIKNCIICGKKVTELTLDDRVDMRKSKKFFHKSCKRLIDELNSNPKTTLYVVLEEYTRQDWNYGEMSSSSFYKVKKIFLDRNNAEFYARKNDSYKLLPPTNIKHNVIEQLFYSMKLQKGDFDK